MSNCGIYKIENLINGKLYIGQSINLRRREVKHFTELRNNKHVNKHLQRAFNKYGEENFKFGIMLFCEQSELTYYEDFFIKYYNTQSLGYNICDANSPPDNSGKNNGMYGKTPANARRDIDDNIEYIAEEYENGEPLSHLAKKYGIARRHMRAKLRTVFTKEEMEIINKQNQKNPTIKRDNQRGMTHGLEARINMSKSNNTSGYFRVSYDTYRDGAWIYKYYDENKKRRKLSAKTIELLEKRVKERGLPWIKLYD